MQSIRITIPHHTPLHRGDHRTIIVLTENTGDATATMDFNHQLALLDLLNQDLHYAGRTPAQPLSHYSPDILSPKERLTNKIT